MKMFRKEQRVSRRRYKISVRSKWEAEIADDKENGEVTLPIHPEDETEAFENYPFDRMAIYDADSAGQLGQFRSSLRIVPERLGGPSPVLRQSALLRFGRVCAEFISGMMIPNQWRRNHLRYPTSKL